MREDYSPIVERIPKSRDFILITSIRYNSTKVWGTLPHTCFYFYKKIIVNREEFYMYAYTAKVYVSNLRGNVFEINAMQKSVLNPFIFKRNISSVGHLCYAPFEKEYKKI